jgi:hypothetical protein
MLLIAAPLCVVVFATSVAVAAPSGTDPAGDEKLDNPHAVRPIAASTSVFDANGIAMALGQAIASLRTFKLVNSASSSTASLRRKLPKPPKLNRPSSGNIRRLLPGRVTVTSSRA